MFVNQSFIKTRFSFFKFPIEFVCACKKFKRVNLSNRNENNIDLKDKQIRDISYLYTKSIWIDA